MIDHIYSLFKDVFSSKIIAFMAGI